MRKKSSSFLQCEKKPGDVWKLEYVHRYPNLVLKVSLVPSFSRLAHADRHLTWLWPDLSPRVASAPPFSHAMLVTLQTAACRAVFTPLLVLIEITAASEAASYSCQPRVVTMLLARPDCSPTIRCSNCRRGSLYCLLLYIMPPLMLINGPIIHTNYAN